MHKRSLYLRALFIRATRRREDRQREEQRALSTTCKGCGWLDFCARTAVQTDHPSVFPRLCTLTVSAISFSVRPNVASKAPTWSGASRLFKWYARIHASRRVSGHIRGQVRSRSRVSRRAQQMTRMRAHVPARSYSKQALRQHGFQILRHALPRN